MNIEHRTSNVEWEEQKKQRSEGRSRRTEKQVVKYIWKELARRQSGGESISRVVNGL